MAREMSSIYEVSDLGLREHETSMSLPASSDICQLSKAASRAPVEDLPLVNPPELKRLNKPHVTEYR